MSEVAFRRVECIQYTGSNGADVVALLNAIQTNTVWTVKSQSGASVILTPGSSMLMLNDYTVPMNNWMVCAPGVGVVEIATDARYKSAYITQNDITTPRYGGLGLMSLPGLSTGQAPFDVTIRPTQPDMNYRAESFLSGSLNLLGTLSIVSTTKKNESTVTVVVKNTGLAVTGAALLVHVS